MPFEKVDTKSLAKKYGIDINTIRAKHELIEKIIAARKKSSLSQKELAALIGKSQSFIAKIENGIGTKNFSFDLLLKILNVLGYQFKISIKKSSEDSKLAAWLNTILTKTN